MACSIVTQSLLENGIGNDQYALLQSGSLADNQADPGSDLDLAVVFREQDHKQVIKTRDYLLSTLGAHFRCNIDLVLLEIGTSGVVAPWDFIDRNIVATGEYLAGNAALGAVRSHVVLNANEILFTGLVQRRAARFFVNPTPGLKHLPGGRRDIMRAKQALQVLETANGPSEQLSDLLKQAETLKNGLLDSATLSALLPGTASAQVAREAATQGLPEGMQLVETAHTMLRESCLPVTLRQFVAVLLERMVKRHPISKAELLTIQSQADLRDALPLCLASAQEIDEDTFFLGTTYGWLGYMGILANPRTSHNVLKQIAAISGYECRNLVDQVPRHPNVSMATLETLARSEYEFTRIRAKQVLNLRCIAEPKRRATYAGH